MSRITINTAADLTETALRSLNESFAAAVRDIQAVEDLAVQLGGMHERGEVEGEADREMTTRLAGLLNRSLTLGAELRGLLIEDWDVRVENRIAANKTKG